MDYKQLIIARKDLNMSPGKLAAQVSHGSLAYFTNLIKNNSTPKDDTKFNTYKNGRGLSISDRDGVIFYRRGDLYKLARAAHERGEEFFYATPADPDKRYSEFVPCDPHPYYSTSFTLDAGLYEGWIEGSFTKIVCEARNRNQLFKAATLADELGLKENEDYFIIRDNCLTELEPEDPDGRTPTVIGFRPLPNEIVEAVSRKFQLYK